MKIKRERNLCLVMLITGALQNVRALRVIRKAADNDNSSDGILMKGGVGEDQEEKPGDQREI